MHAGSKGRGRGVATRLCSVRTFAHIALHLCFPFVLPLIAIGLVVSRRIISHYAGESKLHCRMHFMDFAEAETMMLGIRLHSSPLVPCAAIPRA